MSSDGRWRSSKIVVPPTQGREQELIGGLKNAVDRGETLVKAQQSFVNAGYSKEEVVAAARKIPAGDLQKKTPVAAPNPQAVPVQKVPTMTTAPVKKKASKTMKIILIATSVLVLIGAALLGIFWDKVFP